MNRYYHNLGILFVDIARINSQNAALRYSGRTLSYAELEDKATGLANMLAAQGLLQGDVIAIGHNKNPLSFALMLAALRLGVAYVNIDTGSPLTRNVKILNTSQPKILFYDDDEAAADMKTLGEAASCRPVALTEDILISEPAGEETLDARMALVDGATIAYIMFTSGSTGEPKGVAVTHQNILHFIAWGLERFSVTSADIFTNVSPMYFDNSVFDFYVGLFSGASLFPVDRKLLSDPYTLSKQASDMECTIWFSVPSLLIYLTAMKALGSNALPAIRRIIFGGEGYPKPELKKLYDIFHNRAVLVNVYGPTECTCICSAYDISRNDFLEMHGLPPLGTLNRNFDYLILNDANEETDFGELCLIGPNVASGYFGNPALTVKAFATLEQPERYMKRMYRTGDLVRQENGLLYFQGRKDYQIKHMGYRIELEEIEHAMMQVDGVTRAAALYHRANIAYGKIIGFVATSGALTESDIIGKLTPLLPDYMIPAKIMITGQLPKNANGKVDRKALDALL